MTVFGMDTAGRTVSVALMRDGQLLYECYQDAGLTHSETLMPLVDAAFKATGLTPADVELWGVCAGPGSFTGLRIGLAAVKGLAFCTGAPCAPVSTLEALAYSFVGEGTVISALDARRGQVYWAAFDLAPGHARLVPDAAAGLEDMTEFLQNCKKPVFFVGDGAALCYNRYGSLPGVLPCPPALQRPRASAVCLAALEMNQKGLCVPPARLLPSYLRLSQAERERQARIKGESMP